MVCHSRSRLKNSAFVLPVFPLHLMIIIHLLCLCYMLETSHHTAVVVAPTITVRMKDGATTSISITAAAYPSLQTSQSHHIQAIGMGGYIFYHQHMLQMPLGHLIRRINQQYGPCTQQQQFQVRVNLLSDIIFVFWGKYTNTLFFDHFFAKGIIFISHAFTLLKKQNFECLIRIVNNII